MGIFQVRPITVGDRGWLSRLIRERWGSGIVVSKARLHEPGKLEGFMVSRDEKLLGAVTYSVDEDECEVVTIDSMREGIGVGSLLLEAVRMKALSLGCHRLWLITTNDNLPALRFYQKRGLRLVAVYPNALERSRMLKPGIPLVGRDGIPLRDELELELLLA